MAHIFDPARMEELKQSGANPPPTPQRKRPVWDITVQTQPIYSEQLEADLPSLLKQTQQKLKPSSNHCTQSTPSSSAFIRPPTGYYPVQQPPSSSSYTPQYQPNHWLSSNYAQRGRTG